MGIVGATGIYDFFVGVDCSFKTLDIGFYLALELCDLEVWGSGFRVEDFGKFLE